MKSEWFRRITYWSLAAIGGLILLGLTYYSFFYTQFMRIRWDEMAEDRKDQPLWNLAALLAAALLAFGLGKLEKKLGEKRAGIVELLLLAVSTGMILAAGLWWITALDRVPVGDQAFVYGGASYFLEGSYTFLGHGGYCQIYPQQLGQIAVVELLFSVVGTYQYFVIEVLCVLFAAGIHLLGYGIIRELGAGFVTRLLYLLLMMGCIPLICYTSWVYGDLPSTFFLFLFTLLALRLRRVVKWYYVAGMTAAFVMAALVRKNSMIFLVAFVIVALMDLILKRRWRMVIAAALALICSLLSYQIVYGVYEHQSGYPIEGGLPVNSWIAMGMEESYIGNGWYNNKPKEVGADFDWDYPAVERFYAAYIRDRLAEFRENPGYAFRFYKKKVLSQWNEPLYQCIFFSKDYREEAGPAPGSFLDRLYHTGDAYERLLFWADRWQFLIYLGTLFYFLTGIRKKEEPVNLLFAVTIVGGFLFSILWEAKARYCLPYYLMMYATAVLGYEALAQSLHAAALAKGRTALRHAPREE